VSALDPVGLWALFLFAVVTICGCAALWYCTGLPDPDESREGDPNHDRLQG
jgi:hypothetical protein